MKSLLLKLGMLLVVMGVSFLLIWSSEPQGRIASITNENAGGALPTSPVLHERAPTVELIEARGRSTQTDRRMLDINRATADELESLPGIGVVLAQRVIAFRASAGGFRTVEDLRQVKGIGAKKFDRLKSLVTVSISDSKTAVKQPIL